MVIFSQKDSLRFDPRSEVEALKRACVEKDLQEFDRVLRQQPALINEIEFNEGGTILSLTCADGWTEGVKFLLDNYFDRIDVNHKDLVGRTPLIQATYSGHRDCLMLLLSHPTIDVNIQDKDGFTALSGAVSGGKVDCVTILLSHLNIDINIKDKNGFTALSRAVTGGKVECVRLLLSHPNIDVNARNKNGYTALYQAVTAGKVDCVRLLLSHPNIDVNFEQGEWFDMTVLWYCKERASYELLLPHFQTMTEHDKIMAWMWSLYYHGKGNVEEVKEVLRKFELPNLSQVVEGLNSMVWIAANRGDVKMIEYFISSHGNIINANIQSKNGLSALSRAVSRNDVDTVRSLLSFDNIDVNIQDKRGYTALYQAVSSGKIDCIRLLLFHPRIDVNIQDKDGYTALYQAVTSGKVDCLRLLLTHPSIDVNMQDKFGKTALHHAILWNRLECSDILLKYPKIDVTIRDKTGKTASEMKGEDSLTHSTQLKESRSIPGDYLEEGSHTSKLALSTGKKTHVYLSHDWGIDGRNHHRVKMVSEALKSRGLITWIDDEFLDCDMDKTISDALDHTECMLVVLTENYVKKVNDKDHWCWREFNSLGRERMIAVILDDAMRDRSKWGKVSSALGATECCDLSSMFKSQLNEVDRSTPSVIDNLYKMILDNISKSSKRDITPIGKATKTFVYDVLLVSAFDHVEGKHSLIDQININLRKHELVTFLHHDRKEISRCIPLSKLVIVFAINKELTLDTEKFNLDFKLSSIRGKVILVLADGNKELEIWASKELKAADIYQWSSNQPFDHNYRNLWKMIQEATGDKEKVLIDEEAKDLKEDKVRRTLFYSSLVLCTNTELFRIFRSVPLADIDSSNSVGYTPIQLYFFLFLNQFTFSCPSLEKIIEEIQAKFFEPSKFLLCSKLRDSTSKYKDTLSLNGGDYSKVLLKNSLVDYFEVVFFRDGAPSDLGDQESLKSLASGSLTTSKDLTPHREMMLSSMMTSSSDVLMEVKYFLVKIIFIILYQELQSFYVAWEFLLDQLLSDALTVRTVLSSITSFKKEDYRAQFFMMQTLTTKKIVKDLLSQRRHPLYKIGEISNMLSRHLPKGSETLSEDAHSLMAEEINELYQRHDQRDLTYYLCGRIHRHRDNWISKAITQNTDLTEEGKRVLTLSLNQSMKWIGYSLSSNASKDSLLSMSTFRTRKKELMNGWKDSIDQLIFTLIESRLENWILPLLYLLIESIYSYQLLITHLLQLNLFQLPYSCSLLTVERKEFPSFLPSINPTESFQPPESNYDYHVELAELSWILLKDSRHVNFTSFNQGKAWLDNCHFPFAPLIKGESKNEKNLDVEKIIAYFQIRGTKSVENEAREIIINSETNDVWKKLSNLFGSEMKLFVEPNTPEETYFPEVNIDLNSEPVLSVLSFNSFFNGEKHNSINILPDHLEEIQLILRKYISTIFDYLFILYLMVTGFIRSSPSQGRTFDDLVKDCERDQSLGRKFFPFLFEKLPFHYVNKFYAVMEIITQPVSLSYLEKYDIKSRVIGLVVRFILNNFSSIKPFKEEIFYESLNEIRVAIRFPLSSIHHQQIVRRVEKKSIGIEQTTEEDYKETELFLLARLQSMKELFDENHPDTLILMCKLADFYRRQGVFDQALSLYGQCLKIVRSILGEQHPQASAVTDALINVYRYQGKNEDARMIKELYSSKREIMLQKSYVEREKIANVSKRMENMENENLNPKIIKDYDFVQDQQVLKETPIQFTWNLFRDSWFKIENFLRELKDIYPDIVLHSTWGDRIGKISEEDLRPVYSFQISNNKSPKGIDEYEIYSESKTITTYWEEYTGLHKQSNIEVTVDVYDLVKTPAYLLKNLQNEISLLSCLKIPTQNHMVKYYGTHYENNKLYIVKEKLYGKEILGRINDMSLKDYNESNIKIWIHDLFHVIHDLHQQNIVHRAILPENIRFSSDGSDGKLVLTNFRQAKRLHPLSITNITSFTSPDELEEMESLENEKAKDMWSLGALLHLLFLGSTPFSNVARTDLLTTIQNYRGTDFKRRGGTLKQWECISKEGKDLAKRLLEKNPVRTMTITEACKHPWFAGQNRSQELISTLYHIRRLYIIRKFRKLVRVLIFIVRVLKCLAESALLRKEFIERNYLLKQIDTSLTTFPSSSSLTGSSDIPVPLSTIIPPCLRETDLFLILRQQFLNWLVYDI